MDTFAKLRGQSRSGNLYSDDYASLEDVQRLSHGYNVAILVIHHTGKESRDDPLDEVNATQGLNGVADTILVLRRERGKREATLMGDGRELIAVEQTLRFDLASGGWRVTEPPEEQPRTPERAEILALLKASDEPLSPRQVAEALGKHPSTIRSLLPKMVQAGEVKTVMYGKYLPVAGMDSVDSVDTSSRKKSPQQQRATLPRFEQAAKRPSDPTESTESTESIPRGEDEGGEDEAEPLPAIGK